MDSYQQTQIYKNMLRYAELYKLPIFPCRGKIPLIRGWPDLGVPSKDTLSRWKSKYPNMNVGLVLGEKSGILGIDVDGSTGKKELDRISGGDLPQTWFFKTPGGGYRYLYRIKEGKTIKKKVFSLPGDHQEVAIMGDGTQTILPPSVHPNGGIYKWVKGCSPIKSSLADAPNWIYELFTANGPNKSPISYDLERLATRCEVFQEDFEIQKNEGLPEESWFLWLSLLVNAGYDDAALKFSESSDKHNARSIERLLILQNNRGDNTAPTTRCSTFGCNDIHINLCHGKLRCNEKGEAINSPSVHLKKVKRDKTDISQLKEFGFVFNDDGKFKDINGNLFAAHINEIFTLVYEESSQTFYQYMDGVYIPLTELDLSKMLRNLLHSYVPDIWTEYLESKYISALKRTCALVEIMNDNRNYINFNNGVLNLSSLKLESHRPDLYSSIRIPIDYDSQAKCPNFNKYLDDVFKRDKKLKKLVQEMLGYCLTAETRAQKAFLLYGDGANGKSVLIKTLIKLAGEKNVSAVPLSDFSKSFSRYRLVNKTLNTTTESELNSKGLNTEYFKSIVSGDPIEVEIKHGPSFLYEPFCKLVFAVNTLPYSKDKSHGFSRRLVIIPFTETFKGKKDDKNLLDRLLQELPGILNFALKGLVRLRNNDFVFTKSKKAELALNQYRRSLNPMVAFVQDCILEVVPPGKVPSKTLFTTYKSWCSDNGHKYSAEMSQTTFVTAFKKVLTEENINFTVKKSGGIRYFMDLDLKP